MKPRTTKSEGIAARLLVSARAPQPKVNGITQIRGNAAERAAAWRLACMNEDWIETLRVDGGLNAAQIRLVMLANQTMRGE